MNFNTFSSRTSYTPYTPPLSSSTATYAPPLSSSTATYAPPLSSTDLKKICEATGQKSDLPQRELTNRDITILNTQGTNVDQTNMWTDEVLASGKSSIGSFSPIQEEVCRLNDNQSYPSLNSQNSLSSIPDGPSRRAAPVPPTIPRIPERSRPGETATNSNRLTGFSAASGASDPRNQDNRYQTDLWTEEELECAATLLLNYKAPEGISTSPYSTTQERLNKFTSVPNSLFGTKNSGSPMPPAKTIYKSAHTHKKCTTGKEKKLLAQDKEHENFWERIAKCLPGRTKEECQLRVGELFQHILQQPEPFRATAIQNLYDRHGL